MKRFLSAAALLTMGFLMAGCEAQPAAPKGGGAAAPPAGGPAGAPAMPPGMPGGPDAKKEAPAADEKKEGETPAATEEKKEDAAPAATEEKKEGEN